MLKDYIKVFHSDRRGEVKVLDLLDKQLFSVNENHFSKESLEDEELLKKAVLENYSDVIEDSLSTKSYFGKIINVNDSDYGDLYEISIHNYDNEYFYVFAYDPEMALEILVGHLASKGETGHFYSVEEIRDSEDENEDNYIYIDCSEYTDSDNFLFYLSNEHTHVRKYEG